MGRIFHLRHRILICLALVLLVPASDYGKLYDLFSKETVHPKYAEAIALCMAREWGLVFLRV